MDSNSHIHLPPMSTLDSQKHAHSDLRQSSPHHHPSTMSVFPDRLDRPSSLPSYPPPSYSQTREPISHRSSDPVKPELPPILPHPAHGDQSRPAFGAHGQTLPSLSSLTEPTSAPRNPSFQSGLPAYTSSPTPSASPSNNWPSCNPLTAYYTPSHVNSGESPMRMDVDGSSTTSRSAASPDRLTDLRASSVSLDDPDVRLAAEALGDLKADFVSSPSNKATPQPSSPRSQASSSQPEPLFSLLTTSHPLLATTIEGATSAYINSKNYSPRFRSGAEYVEGYVLPIANTVGSVSRVTGVEGSVRWFLEGRARNSRDANLDSDDSGSKKRRKVDGIADSALSTQRDRRASDVSMLDELPAYDNASSPPYTERSTPRDRQSGQSMQSRIVMTTSGLSIAMTEESLRKLKLCMTWIKRANVRIRGVVESLKVTIEKLETRESQGRLESGDTQMQGAQSPNDETSNRSLIARQIIDYRLDVVSALKDVTSILSRYATGALPANARDLVAQHLRTFPRRCQIAEAMGQRQQGGQGEEVQASRSSQGPAENPNKEQAQRVLVLATEGLDMIGQLFGVLDGTITSAEEWCEKLEQRKREEREGIWGTPSQSPPAPQSDVKMG